jgi:hypothetical protein
MNPGTSSRVKGILAQQSGVLLASVMQRYASFLLATLLLPFLACDHSKTTAPGRLAEPYLSDSNSVAFEIEPLENVNGSFRLRATYSSQRHTAKFRIEFDPSKPVGSKDPKDFPMKVGEGRFVAEPGSDATGLLLDLKKALDAKTLPSKVHRLESLPFTFVSSGEELSQAAGGGFNADRPGNWEAIKIFIGEGAQEAEMFVNINTVVKKGQFLMKDPDDGDLALAQLARVLQNVGPDWAAHGPFPYRGYDGTTTIV